MRPFFMARWAPELRSLLRIVAAAALMQHGVQKLFGLLGGVDGQGGTVELMSRYGLAGVLETFVALLLLIGLFSRPAAFLLAGEMAAAYFIAHVPNGFWPIQNRGEVLVLFCFIFLYLSAAGPGPWSVDALRARGGPDAERRVP